MKQFDRRVPIQHLPAKQYLKNWAEARKAATAAQRIVVGRQQVLWFVFRGKSIRLKSYITTAAAVKT